MELARVDVASAEVRGTLFLYVHHVPARIHLLAVDMEGCVTLMSDPQRWPIMSSGRHGSHSYFRRHENEGLEWQACFHYDGDRANFMRVYRARLWLWALVFKIDAYVLFYVGRPWAIVVKLKTINAGTIACLL